MTSMAVNKRICIFSFSAAKFQEICLPYPTNVISVIDTFLPKMAILRNEKLQDTMRVIVNFKYNVYLRIIIKFNDRFIYEKKDVLKALDRDPTSVEDFIEHLAILSRITNELPSLEKEYAIVTRLFMIANEFNLNIDPEQYAFFKSLGSKFHHLKVNNVI